MPPHHHHRRHRPGRGFRGGQTVYFDSAPEIVETVLVTPSDLDLIMIPPTDDKVEKEHQAGDILPTVVTAESAKAYIHEVDTAYSVLNGDIVRSNAPIDFKASWGMQLAGWNTFQLGALASVGFFDAKAVMGQTDRYATELANWRKTFLSLGGTPSGPAPIPPGQGIPDPQAGSATNLVVAVGIVAAIVVLGPTLARHFSH